MGIDKALSSVTNTLANFNVPYNLVDISLERAVINIDTAKLVELFYMRHDFTVNLRSLRNKIYWLIMEALIIVALFLIIGLLDKNKRA